MYELVGYKGEVSKNKLYQIALYEKAFHLYVEKKFNIAILLLKKLLKKNAMDKAAQLLLERCQAYILNAPYSDWQGEYVLEGK